MRILAIATFLLTTMLGSEVTNSKEVAPFRSGAWDGGVFFSDDTGRFSSCIASMGYRSGIHMHVVVGRNYSWQLGFQSSNWKLKTDQTIDLQYRFDNGAWHAVIARAIAENQISIPMPTNGQIVNRFRRGRTLEISDNRESFYFDLTGTWTLIPALANCVENQLAHEQNSNSNEPTQTRTGQSSSGEKFLDNPKLELEATRVLSNFILAANLSNSILVDRNRVKEDIPFTHAAAIGPDAMSFAMVLPNIDEARTDEFVTVWLSDFSSKCGGKYASGIAKGEAGPRASKDGFAVCQTADETRQLRYILVARPNTGFYLVGLLSETSTVDSANDPNDNAISDSLLRDAVFKATR